MCGDRYDSYSWTAEQLSNQQKEIYRNVHDNNNAIIRTIFGFILVKQHYLTYTITWLCNDLCLRSDSCIYNFTRVFLCKQAFMTFFQIPFIL